MGARFEVDAAQLDQLAADLHAVGVQLADLEPVNTEASRVVHAAARPPRRSGALAAGLRADPNGQGVTFASSARYWTFVHWGAPRRNIKARPWWPEALTVSRDQLLAVYARHAATTLDKIG